VVGWGGVIVVEALEMVWKDCQLLFMLLSYGYV
jgi:hypothetical protein